MNKAALSKDEREALQRVKGGYVIDHDMRNHLSKRRLIDQLLGGDRVSREGLRALGVAV